MCAGVCESVMETRKQSQIILTAAIEDYDAYKSYICVHILLLCYSNEHLKAEFSYAKLVLLIAVKIVMSALTALCAHLRQHY